MLEAVRESLSPARAFFERLVWLGCGTLLALLVVLVLLSIWIYRDAERRGEEGVAWVVILLLTAGIGAFIWLIIRPKERQW